VYAMGETGDCTHSAKGHCAAWAPRIGALFTEAEYNRSTWETSKNPNPPVQEIEYKEEHKESRSQSQKRTFSQ